MRLIDADELIKDIKRMAFTSDLTTTCAVGMACDWIENAPTIESKKGKWRWSEDMECFICSECESGWKEQPTLMGKPLYEWCPCCGADMRGDAE